MILTAVVPPSTQAGFEAPPVDTTIVTLTVSCAVAAGATSAVSLSRPGAYAYSIVGACDFSTNSPDGCFVSVHSAYYHGCGTAPQQPDCLGDGGRLSVHIDGRCVGPSPGGIIELGTGPVSARFVDDPGEYGNNFGSFEVTLTWTPPESDGVVVLEVDCADPDGTSLSLSTLPAGNYEFLVAGACDFGYDPAARPGCHVSVHVLVKRACDPSFQATTCSPDPAGPTLSVLILGQCVAPYSSGIVSLSSPRPANARFDDDPGAYWNNIGEFVVVLERVTLLGVERPDPLELIG